MSRTGFDALTPESRTEAARLAAKLTHDVGKYMAMTARNLPAGPVPDALVTMLVRDLYKLAKGKRASECFAELALPLEQIVREPRLDQVRTLLAQIDGLEAAVRSNDPDAVSRAADLATEVERVLREVARDARGEP